MKESIITNNNIIMSRNSNNNNIYLNTHSHLSMLAWNNKSVNK